jgi:hypothetical protein
MKTYEIWFLLFWNVIAFLLSLTLGVNYLASGFLFLGLPSIYLTLRKPQIFRKLFTVAATFTVSGTAILSYLAHKDGSWYNPSMFGIRVLNAYPIDDFLWGFMFFYYAIAFYECFYEKDKTLVLPKKFSRSWKIAFGSATVFSLLAYAFPQYLEFPYFYIILILVAIVGLPWTLLSLHQSLIPKIVKAGAFFLPVAVCYEYVANLNGNWFFPGTHFIGYVTLGSVRFPLEEFLWVLLVGPAILCYYELMACDEK